MSAPARSSTRRATATLTPCGSSASFASGPLMGNLSFTPKPDHTIDFVDRDGNYKAVLHPCPN